MSPPTRPPTPSRVIVQGQQSFTALNQISTDDKDRILFLDLKITFLQVIGEMLNQFVKLYFPREDVELNDPVTILGIFIFAIRLLCCG